MKQLRRYRITARVWLALVLALLAPAAVVVWGQAQRTQTWAERQSEAYLRANYTKFEYEIPMRDGVKLFTAVYVPKDASQPYPILMTRTPYSVAPYGVDLYPNSLAPEAFAKEGFIFVRQDVRGRLRSGGEFMDMRPHKPVKSGPSDTDESTDTWDTVDWLVKNIPNNNGRVGMWGISYPGFYSAAGMIDAHPALKAVSPQAPIADWFIGDDFHHNGALYLAHAFRFFGGFGRRPVPPQTLAPPRFDPGTPDGYQFFLEAGPLSNINARYFKNEIAFWNQLMEHPNYDDFWKARNLLPHLKNIKPAVMTVGGWFDAEDLYGPLKIYEMVEKSSPGIHNMLVMGPWSHGGWMREGESLGHVRFQSKTGDYYREKMFLPFFLHHLKGKGERKLPEAYVFETGTNQWKQYDAWPPKNTTSRTLYFQPNGKLAYEPPADTAAASYDEYVSDPAKPVPYIPNISFNMTIEHMLDDQRFAASRTDVLVYQTEVLSEDIILAGPLVPELYVSTTGTDSDWVVKLIDVYPNNFPDPDPNPTGVRMGGYQQLVRGELMRGRFRNSFEKPEAFVPGKTTKVRYTMPDVNHTFRRGHRIMVQVQSSWFPLVDRNPQKFVDIYHAREEDFQKATQRVYRGKATPSVVHVQVLK